MRHKSSSSPLQLKRLSNTARKRKKKAPQEPSSSPTRTVYTSLILPPDSWQASVRLVDESGLPSSSSLEKRHTCRNMKNHANDALRTHSFRPHPWARSDDVIHDDVEKSLGDRENDDVLTELMYSLSFGSLQKPQNMAVAPEFNEDLAMALSAEHRDNVRLLEFGNMLESLSGAQVVSLLKTVDFCMEDTAVPKFLYDSLLKHQEHVLEELEGYGIHDEVKSFFDIMGQERSLVCMYAARSGRLDLLHYAHTKGYPWSEATCEKAASRGHMDCLKYAHEHGCDWDEATCAKAARGGHLECLIYAHEQECPWDEETCAQAVVKGGLECLTYAHNKGCEWDESTTAHAALYGRMDCLRYAHKNGCRWDTDTCTWAAQRGNLDCLKYAHKKGCPWTTSTTKMAAAGGHLDCLQYLHENNCPWGRPTCEAAAAGGHLDCLRYAHQMGCQWDWRTCKGAAERGELMCLKYAFSRMKRLSSVRVKAIWRAARLAGNKECEQYILRVGGIRGHLPKV